MDVRETPPTKILFDFLLMCTIPGDVTIHGRVVFQFSNLAHTTPAVFKTKKGFKMTCSVYE